MLRHVPVFASATVHAPTPVRHQACLPSVFLSVRASELAGLVPGHRPPVQVLSSDLIEKIVKDDEPNSILWAPYGSFDEDAQTGRWVDYAAKHHNLTVTWWWLLQSFPAIVGSTQAMLIDLSSSRSSVSRSSWMVARVLVI